MSRRDMGRCALLQRAVDGQLTVRQITEALGVSYRQALRLKQKVAGAGLPGLLHGNRGRPPSNKLEATLREQVLALSRKEYFDFNDAHFQEVLAVEEGVLVSRETVRRWRRDAGIPPKQRRRPPKHRKRRPRSQAEGLMMLWDGSPHHWFGEEKPACCLMAALDDATGSVLAAWFAQAETSWAYLKLLELVLLGWGVPASVYQDRHGSLRRNDDYWSLAEELAGRQAPTQVGAALEALGITTIFALSPQAKGRVERLFRTLQDRLLASLRKAGVTDLPSANAFLPDYVSAHNRRFAKSPALPEPLWRTPPPRSERERLLSLCYPAKVGNDNAVRLDGLIFDLPPGPNRRSYAREQVHVRQLLDGRWRIYQRERLLLETPATEIAELIRTRRRRKGVPSAHDDAWAFAASKPSPAERDLLDELAAGRPPAGIRRAGPGGLIKGTRLA